jgi:adenylate kinase
MKLEGARLLAGINGVGKSTIVNAIASHNSGIFPIHASAELRDLFGGVSHEELESMTPEQKLARMAVRFTELFTQARDEKKVALLDTHILVPIRRNNVTQYEDIWAEEYRKWIGQAAMLIADPVDILTWRADDEIKTGRVRDLSLDHIDIDQRLNLRRFSELVSWRDLPSTSRIVRNSPDDWHSIEQKVVDDLML